LKPTTKLHRDTLRHLGVEDLRRIAGGPKKSGQLTCGGETVDTCEDVTTKCEATRACGDSLRTCAYSQAYYYGC
jgi:hypothetical protein